MNIFTEIASYASIWARAVNTVNSGGCKDVTQRTAWFLNHRIREMLADKAPELLTEVVEINIWLNFPVLFYTPDRSWWSIVNWEIMIMIKLDPTSLFSTWLVSCVRSIPSFASQRIHGSEWVVQGVQDVGSTSADAKVKAHHGVVCTLALPQTVPTQRTLRTVTSRLSFGILVYHYL